MRRYYVVDSNGFALRADASDPRRFGCLTLRRSPHPVPRAAFETRRYAISAAREAGLNPGEFWIVCTVGEV